jgi:hypothetical protein
MQERVQVYETAALGNPNVNNNSYKLSDPGAHTLRQGQGISAIGRGSRSKLLLL